MTGRYILSDEMKGILAKLRLRIRTENVPDPGMEMFSPAYSLERRQILYLWSLFENATAQELAKPKPSSIDTPSGEPASAAPVAEQSTGTALVLSEFSDPPASPPAPPASDPPPSPPATGAPPSPPESPPPPLAPQPGGVPALPTRPVSSRPPPPIEMTKKNIRLLNARANEAYDVNATALIKEAYDVNATAHLKDVTDLRLEDEGGTGLMFDEASGRLRGTPTTSGDFQVRFQGRLHGKRTEIIAELTVIADPRTLWLKRDSDRTDPFWKPDEAFERIEGDLLCVAASKRGRSHAQNGTFRDDDFGLWTSGPGGWHIAVVADGAGSAKFSRRGSKVAVDRILRDLPELLEDRVTPYLGSLVPAHRQGHPDAAIQIKSQLYQSLATAAFNAAKSIEEEAAAINEKPSAFSTTLIVAVARRIPEGWFLAAFSIGDGGAAVFDARDGSLTVLTLPDNGEFAGQTRFLQKSEFADGFDAVSKRLFFDIRSDFTVLALMTDGISDPKFSTDATFANPMAWSTFWTDEVTRSVDFSRSNPEMETQFLDWLDFWSQGNHDDRTLAILMP